MRFVTMMRWRCEPSLTMALGLARRFDTVPARLDWAAIEGRCQGSDPRHFSLGNGENIGSSPKRNLHVNWARIG
jgi:hypothetical protein